ncbi:MAG: flippase, partial [Candidatus Pacebacteria bacterium]|nr:flippase [Candidatus Paceibacterota bacterium]
MKGIRRFFFTNQTTGQTVAKNTIWLFVGEIGSRLLKMLVFIYAARKLGVSEWGLFSYVLALIGLVFTLSDIGINSVITREVSRKDMNESHYISTSFFLKIILSFAGSFAVLVLFFLKSPGMIKNLLPLGAIMLFLDSMREFGFALNRAFQRMEVEAITKIASNSVLVVVMLLLTRKSTSASSLLLAYIIAGVVGIAIMTFDIRGHFVSIFSNFKKNLLWHIFKEAWPIAIISIFGTVLANIDTIILGLFRNFEEVGFYSAAQRPIQIVYLIPGLISTALLPVFSRLVSQEKNEMKTVLGRSITLGILISLPIVTGGLILGTGIITLVLGHSYVNSIGIFKIMLTPILVSIPGTIISGALFAAGKQKKILQSIIFGAITNVIFCLVLIPKFGMYGAAISTTLSQLLYNISLIIWAQHTPSLKFEFAFGKILSASLVMAIAVLLSEYYLG